MKWRIFSTILSVVILIAPGSKAGLFNGLPLSALELTIAFFLFWSIWSLNWDKSVQIRKIVISLLSIFLFFQLTSYWLVPSGWSTCVYSDISREKKLNNELCEPTVEFPSGIRSYILSGISFSRNSLPIYFLNDTSYLNFYLPEQPKRKSLPFTIDSLSYIYPRKDSSLSIKSDQDVMVKINGIEKMAPKKEKSTFVLEPNKENVVQVKYSANRSKSNFVEVESTNIPYYKKLQYPGWITFFYHAYKFINILIICILTTIFFTKLFEYIKNLKKADVAVACIALASIVPAYFLTKEFGLHMFFFYCLAISSTASFHYVTRPEEYKKKILPLTFLFFFALSLMLTSFNVSTRETVLFEGGMDEVGHESFARNTFTVTSFDEFIHSTEDNMIYYYQPLPRYFLAFLHIVSGEPMWGPYAIQTMLFFISIWMITAFIYRFFGTFTALSFTTVFTLFSLGIYSSMVGLMQSPLQQSIAFPLLVMGSVIFSSLIITRSNELIKYFAAGLLLSAGIMSRTDWLPILAAPGILAAYVLLKDKLRKKLIISISIFVFGFLIFPLLVGARNYYVAGQFAIIPSTGYVNLLPPFQKSVLKSGTTVGLKLTDIANLIADDFSGKYESMLKILFKNIAEALVGVDSLRLAVWLFSPLLSVISIAILFKKREFDSLMLFISIVIPFCLLIMAGSFFFIHNGVAMTGIYDFLISIIFAIAIGTIYRKYQNKLS